VRRVTSRPMAMAVIIIEVRVAATTMPLAPPS
jgi:low affinity Fe/Cu permease